MEFPDLNTLFTGFTQRESLIFLAFCLVSFLFGLLIGYVLRGRRVRELRRELKKKEAEIQQRDEKIQQLTEELSLQEADLKKANYQKEEAEERAQRLQVEQGKLNNQIVYLKDELEKERAANAGYQSTIDDLNDQILGLRTKVEQGGSGTTVLAGSDAPDVQARLAAVEARLQELEQENARLETTIGTLKSEGSTSGTEYTGDDVDEEPELMQQEAPDILKHDRARAQQAEKDDLTLIDGLGPFLEKKLNDAGVFSYDQIADWDKADIDRITQTIRFFEGRIEKDNWVGQARRLKSLREDNPEALKEAVQSPAAPDTPQEKDNLQLIEGIGPAIAPVLHDRGIHTFSDLAQRSPDEMKAWLREADPSLAMHDPSTWPAQARLAANEQWDVLKDYQDQLRGGK